MSRKPRQLSAAVVKIMSQEGAKLRHYRVKHARIPIARPAWTGSLKAGFSLQRVDAVTRINDVPPRRAVEFDLPQAHVVRYGQHLLPRATVQLENPRTWANRLDAASTVAGFSCDVVRESHARWLAEHHRSGPFTAELQTYRLQVALNTALRRVRTPTAKVHHVSWLALDPEFAWVLRAALPVPVVHRFTFPAVRTDRVGAAVQRRRDIKAEAAETAERQERLQGDDADDPHSRLLNILRPPVSRLLSDLTLPSEPYPFQLQGVRWLMGRNGGVLADEMGLGKTMQAILAARLLYREQAIKDLLIICPKSLMANWRRELSKWWPGIDDFTSIAGPDRRSLLKRRQERAVVKLLSYESLARDTEWLARPDAAAQHDLVIIDEAQRIKNATSKTARAVKAVRGRRNWALTGTPLENRIDDVLSIIDFTDREVAQAIQAALFNYDRATAIALIHQHMLRRRTNDPAVALQLPDLLRQEVEIELSEDHMDRYRQREATAVDELKAEGERVSKMHIFQLIQSLMQLCNIDPATGESAKLERLVEELDEVIDSEGKALVFSRWTKARGGLEWLRAELEARHVSVGIVTGDVPPQERERLMHAFNTLSRPEVLLLQYQAGGVGLNLQGASYVFLFDRWWNPAVEDQAVKRAHRIGQKSHVISRQFFCAGTIEERVLQALQRKRLLAATFIDGGGDGDSIPLDRDELLGLFGLKVQDLRPQRDSHDIASLSPTEFEQYVADLYARMGYRTLRTGGRGDGGVDVVAERQGSDGGLERLAIQCKHVAGSVGPDVVRELLGVLTADGTYTSGVLVVSGFITAEARESARQHRMTLIDGERLRVLVRNGESSG